MKMLEYKGYYGSIEASVEDNVLFGQLEFISALVNYEGETIQELKVAFEGAVNDYLETCKSQGYEPEKPCKGTFNVRIGHGLHLAAAVKAKELGISLNDLVKGAVDKAVAKQPSL